MTDKIVSAVIEPDELAKLTENGSNVKLVDATYGIADPIYPYARIDGAVFFDIDEICDLSSPLPHMLPSPEVFTQAVSGLGISNSDPVVVYDQGGIAMAASRVWWTFRVFGHKNVRVLNGGMAYWHALGLPLNTNPPPKPGAEKYNADFKPELVRSLEAVKNTLGHADACILDARSAERFSGQAAEPRPGMVGGHMPGSLNTPFINLLEPETGRLKDKHVLKHQLNSCMDAEDIITTCGSGVTACVLALALYELGRKDVAVYDGSWSEWGKKELGMPVEVGN